MCTLTPSCCCVPQSAGVEKSTKAEGRGAAYVLDASDVTDSLPSQTRKMLDGLPTSAGLAYQSCPDFVNPAGRGKGWQVERLEEILAFEVPEALHPFPIAAAAW
jgi:hypothetical protein